jgi:NTE family protein
MEKTLGLVSLRHWLSLDQVHKRGMKKILQYSSSLVVAAILACGCLPVCAQNPVPSSAVQPEQQIPSRPAPVSDSGQPSATSSVNSTDVKTGDAVANPADLPRPMPVGRPVIGLALEGGGALGLAHIGVLQWMEEHHVPVDRITGTSMGALVGALYASGKSPAEIQAIAASEAFLHVFALEMPYTNVSFRRRQDRRELPQGIEIGLKGGPSLRNAVLIDSGLVSFLRTNLGRYESTELSFDRLPIPFRCVALDLNTMQRVVFDGGPIPQAVRASISIPALFSPVEYHGHYLVDGAILDNLPTDVVKKDLHADVVIGVHLQSTGFSAADVGSVVGVFARAYAAGTAVSEHNGEKLADILITAPTAQFSTADYAKANALIKTGYQAAEAQRISLLKYALDDGGWKAYLADRASRVRPPPSTLQIVKVEGGTPGAQARVEADVGALKGQPIQTASLTNALQGVQGDGAYQASVETFRTAQPAPPDRVQAQGPDNGILVRLTPVRNGPPFLLFGADITAANSNVTRTTFDFRLIDQNLGGFGSELRSDLRVGFLTQVSSEYYRLLTTSGFFVQPHIGLLREPVYLWQNQQRISERLLQQSGGGLDLGRTVSRNLQYSLQYRAQVLRWRLQEGADGFPNVSGTAQTAVAQVVYDSRESGTVSPRGTLFKVSAGSLFNTVGSENAPMVQATVGRSFSLPSGIIGFSAEGNTYFRRDVAEPLRFTLGGPLRLSASSIDEYRGTDDFLARAAYLHRIAALPFGIGQGLYATFGYEGGEIWSPERPAILRQDGFLMGLAATPLGVIQFGGSVGDAGRRKIFFSFGRLF